MARHKGQVRKRCRDCGAAAWCAPDRTSCREPRFGANSRVCGGLLDPTAKPKPPAAPRPALRPQEVAGRRLMAAQRSVDHWVGKVNDAARALRKAQSKANRFAKLAALSDAEVSARSERARLALAGRQTKRRGIRLEGELG